MPNATSQTSPRTVTSKEALRNWKRVTDNALREPVVITSHGRPRHVLLANEDDVRLRDQGRQAYQTAELPVDLAIAILADLDNLRVPKGTTDDGDTSIS